MGHQPAQRAAEAGAACLACRAAPGISGPPPPARGPAGDDPVVPRASLAGIQRRGHRMSQPAQSIAPITRIQPSRGWAGVNLGELWRHRELLYFLIWRDVKVRYKQTLLGAAWAILKPLFSMIIFYIIFGRLAGIGTDGAPGPVFYFAGLLPWVLFQDGVTKAGNSLVSGSNLITKVYFPRMAIPVALVIAGLVDFVLSFVVLLGMVAFYQMPVTPAASLLPLFV